MTDDIWPLYENVRVVSFYWDCSWRAELAGYEDYYGFPDQAWAAREFGYQCFREFKEVK